VKQATSLSTQMPAAFFSGNFSAVPTTSITGGVLKDPLNGNAPFWGQVDPIDTSFNDHRQAANSITRLPTCRG